MSTPQRFRITYADGRTAEGEIREAADGTPLYVPDGVHAAEAIRVASLPGLFRDPTVTIRKGDTLTVGGPYLEAECDYTLTIVGRAS